MNIETRWRGFALLDIYWGRYSGVRLVRIRCFAVLTEKMPLRDCERLSTRSTISDRSLSWVTGSACLDGSIEGESKPIAIAYAHWSREGSILWLMLEGKGLD